MRGLIAPVATLVLVAGCAATGADRPFTPRQGSSAGPSAATAAPSPVVETIRVGSRLNVLVERPVGQDAELLKVFTDLYTKSWKAVVTKGDDDGYLAGVEDPAGRQAYTWVRGFVSQGRTVRGSARVYAMTVSAVVGDGAQVDACVDESGLVLVSTRTGKAVPSQPMWTREPYLQAMVVRRGDDGVWRVKGLRHATLTDERAKGCAR